MIRCYHATGTISIHAAKQDKIVRNVGHRRRPSSRPETPACPPRDLNFAGPLPSATAAENKSIMMQ